MSSFFSKFFRKQQQKKSEPSLPRLKQNPGASASGPSLSQTMSRDSSDIQVPSDDIVGVDHINTSALNSKKIENEFKLGQKYTRLEIEDSGLGIKPELTEVIFDRFYTSRKGTATVENDWLGSRHIKQIIEAHGGSIAVSQSDLGGAKFSISI